MADRYYIGARYVPAVYEGPDGSNTWLSGVAYEGLVIVTYGNYSYMSKKPVPAGMNPPDVNTDYWIKAAVYNADVNNVVEQLENKADKDGVYPDLFAGNLISDLMQTDNAPYLERETAGGLSGIAPLCYPTLVGASVTENQLATATAPSASGIINNGDGSYTVPVGTDVYFNLNTVKLKANHVYYQNSGKGEDAKCYFRVDRATGTAMTLKATPVIWRYATNSTKLLNIRALNNTIECRIVPQLIDITVLLGSSIADYVYTLEQQTEGSGIAWLRSYGFLGGYVPYNAGSIESVEVTEKKCVGFNQWDEEWEVGTLDNDTGLPLSDSLNIRSKNFCVCIPDATYYFYSGSGKALRYYWYDADYAFISGNTAINQSATAPSNARYFKVRTTQGYGNNYNHDICINLSNPDRNGEYEQYKSTTYPLGNDTLRGIFKLDANNKLYAGGDRKEADGTITRHYGTRAYQSGDESLPDAITDGTTTVYKLTTPTTEQGDPFTSPQVCYPDGTEEYVTGNGVPVGHETGYPYKLKGILEQIAEVPAADGTYTLKATRSGADIIYTWDQEV